MTKIIQRHDTAANWANANPVLAAGEMGVETDTNKFKFGDGSTAWSDLAYATSGSGGETEDVFNKDVFEIVGSPSITDNGIASNFSNSNYVRIPMPNLSTASSWEIDGQFTTGSSYAYETTSVVFGSSASNQVLGIIVEGEGSSRPKLIGHIGITVGNSSGNAWVFTQADIISTTKLDLMSTYNYKIIFTGTAYQLWLAKEDSSYIKEVEYSSNEKISYNSSYNFNIGNTRTANGTGYWLGSINLSKFKIISDGNVIFNGSKKIEKISGTTLISTDGTKTYSKLALGNTLSVAKGNEYIYSPYITFSNEPTNGTFTGGDGRYAKVLIPEYDFHTANSWEFQTKITWGTVRTYVAVMGLYNNKDCHNPVLIYEQGKLGMFLGSNGNNWNITTPSASNLVPVSGTTYYIKMGFTGSQYYFKYNTTGWNYDFTTAQSVNNSNKVYTEGQVQFALLNGFLTVNNYYNDSTMYLEDTALILDNNEIFRAANNVSLDTLNINLNEIPGYSNTGTLVLKSINGVLQWVAEA